VTSNNAVQIIFAVGLVAACGGETPGGPNGTDPGENDATIVFAAVAAGRAHACGLTTNGVAFCWGDNTLGQLGDASYTSSLTPVLVEGNLRFEVLTSAYDHTCGLTDDGEAYCWGDNPFGQLGDGTATRSTGPVRAAANLEFSQLDAGAYHTCGVTASGEAYCWGSNAADGIDGFALGGATTEFCASPYGSYRGHSWACSLTPVAVSGGIEFESISAGVWATCGLAVNGTAYCWGWNAHSYTFGDGTEDDATTPSPVAGGMQFDEVVLGAMHGCGLVNQDAYCWGARVINYGQLGTGSFDGAIAPVPVAGDLSFATVVPSDANNIYAFTCGLTTQGAGYCWGANRHGGLGTDVALSPTCNGRDLPCSNVPVPVAEGLTFISISLGAEFACAVVQNGDAYCWALNDVGQLGNGTTDDTDTPVMVVVPQ
jgi:alpha-tubulin suppressor-like RCC1 family protein